MSGTVISAQDGQVLHPDEIASLLAELCIRLGFCNSLDDLAQLQRTPPADIDAFTDAVFVAEGLDPASPADRPLRRQVRALVADAFERTTTRNRT